MTLNKQRLKKKFLEAWKKEAMPLELSIDFSIHGINLPLCIPSKQIAFFFFSPTVSEVECYHINHLTLTGWRVFIMQEHCSSPENLIRKIKEAI